MEITNNSKLFYIYCNNMLFSYYVFWTFLPRIYLPFQSFLFNRPRIYGACRKVLKHTFRFNL